MNGSRVAWNETQHCKILDGLVSDQLQLCRRNLELMHSIVHAAKETKGVCQKTFSDMRWNCSSIEYAPSFTPDLVKGKRSSVLSSGFSINSACLSSLYSFSFSCSPFTCKSPIVVRGLDSDVRYHLEVTRAIQDLHQCNRDQNLAWSMKRDCRMRSLKASSLFG